MGINEKQLSELESFFTKAKLPKSVQLYAGTNVSDVEKFVQSHLAVLRNNMDKLIYEVFYLRLLRLKEIMDQQIYKIYGSTIEEL